ncbi:phosphate signaling complex protein PhoU [bacterium]|nr:phosphate signaling complex protein PhoU [bacterium]
MLHEKLISLKQKLIEYAALAESMIDKSIKGLLNKEEDLLNEVINSDERKANDLEIVLDELSTNLIAKYQPQAKDLRTILMIMKMNNDLERIGDLAVNISQAAMFLILKPKVKPYIDLPRMAEEARKMLKDSIDSFINEDVALAKSVCERDSIVDGLRDQILRELVTFMTGDTNTIERSIRLIVISRCLERIADLSTNICEDVIFMVKGRIVKHHKDGDAS